jgi:hypothetical protein
MSMKKTERRRGEEDAGASPSESSRTTLANYLTGISLANFRGFKSVSSLPLAPLTFLVGPNSSGKSSIFAALSLIAQSDIDLSLGFVCSFLARS